VRSATFRPLYRMFFWIFLVDCFVLGAVGANPPEGSWITIGQVGTVYYFAHFLVIVPLLSVFERPLAVPASIREPVVVPTMGATMVPGAAE